MSGRLFCSLGGVGDVIGESAHTDTLGDVFLGSFKEVDGYEMVYRYRKRSRVSYGWWMTLS